MHETLEGQGNTPLTPVSMDMSGGCQHEIHRPPFVALSMSNRQRTFREIYTTMDLTVLRSTFLGNPSSDYMSCAPMQTAIVITSIQL